MRKKRQLVSVTDQHEAVVTPLLQEAEKPKKIVRRKRHVISVADQQERMWLLPQHSGMLLQHPLLRCAPARGEDVEN